MKSSAKWEAHGLLVILVVLLVSALFQGVTILSRTRTDSVAQIAASSPQLGSFLPPVTPTATPYPPTATSTPYIRPTNTPVPATAVPPTATNTPPVGGIPTATNTPIPNQGQPKPTREVGALLCPLAPGPYCNTANLSKYFSSAGAAAAASGICNLESSGNSVAVNKTCSSSITGSLDYSIGLFQINLLAHCSSDLLKNYSNESYSGEYFNARNVFAYSGNSPAFPCRVLDQAKLEMCERAMLDPIHNIRKAADMSSQGTNWGPWVTASNRCGV